MQEGNQAEDVYHDMHEDEEVIEIEEDVVSPPPIVRTISSRDIARPDDVPRPAMNIKPKRYDSMSVRRARKRGKIPDELIKQCKGRRIGMEVRDAETMQK